MVPPRSSSSGRDGGGSSSSRIISVDSASLLVSVGMFLVTARWFTNQERQRRSLGLWGAAAATANNKISTNHHQKSITTTSTTTTRGVVEKNIIGSRGIVALETPRVPYLEAFMYCLHVSGLRWFSIGGR